MRGGCELIRGGPEGAKVGESLITTSVYTKGQHDPDDGWLQATGKRLCIREVFQKGMCMCVSVCPCVSVHVDPCAPEGSSWRCGPTSSHQGRTAWWPHSPSGFCAEDGDRR